MDLSEVIRRIREEKRIRQTTIAELLNVEQPSYAYLEKRGEKLTIEQLRKIAAALGVTVDDILHYGEEREQVDAKELAELRQKAKELEELRQKVKLYELAIAIMFEHRVKYEREVFFASLVTSESLQHLENFIHDAKRVDIFNKSVFHIVYEPEQLKEKFLDLLLSVNWAYIKENNPKLYAELLPYLEETNGGEIILNQAGREYFKKLHFG